MWEEPSATPRRKSSGGSPPKSQAPVILNDLSKLKSVKFYWCYTYNYINQWNMHCLSVIIHWFCESTSCLIKIAERDSEYSLIITV